jgi:hypothetical protein
MKKYENLINSTENEKHRFILSLLYRLRLTTGMIINLQIRDIKGNILYCRGRRIYIPDSLMHDFYEFSHNKNPDDYLVKSSLDKKYSIRSIQEIRKKFLKKLRKL